MAGRKVHGRSRHASRLLMVIFSVPLLICFVNLYGKLFSVHSVPKLVTPRRVSFSAQVLISGSKRKPLFLDEGDLEETGGEREREGEMLEKERDIFLMERETRERKRGLEREREVWTRESSEEIYSEEREKRERELNNGIGEEGTEETEKWEGLGHEGIVEGRRREGEETGMRAEKGESGGRGKERSGGENVESTEEGVSGEGVEGVVRREGVKKVEGERREDRESAEKRGSGKGGERGDLEVRGTSGVGVGRKGEEGGREEIGMRGKKRVERDLGYKNLIERENKKSFISLKEEREGEGGGESEVEILKERLTEIPKVDKRGKANLLIKMFHEKEEGEEREGEDSEGGENVGGRGKFHRGGEMRETLLQEGEENSKLELKISKLAKLSKFEETRTEKKKQRKDDMEPKKNKKKKSDSEEFFFGQIPSNSIGRGDLGQVLQRKEMKNFAIHPTYKFRNSSIGSNCTTTQICPNFGFCEKDKTGAIAMCRNTHLNNGGLVGEAPLNVVKPTPRDKQHMLPFEGNVWVLENVYTNKKGHIFNKTHFFLHGGCIFLDDFEYPEHTQVTTFEVLANMISWNAAVNYYHSLVEGMHDFVVMRAVLDRFKDVPVAFRKIQNVGPLKKVVTVVGADVAGLNLQLLGEDLFFAKKMIVPAGQVCGRPAGAVIENVRKTIKVPTLLKRSPKSSLQERTKMKDWQIVVARRDKRRELANHKKFQKEMEIRYGKRRVKSFWGNITMSETVDFFKKTVLYIGVHGAGLTNLYFMPKNSAVLELRPNEFNNPCLQFLANRCELDYYMMIGKGNSSSVLEIDLNEVLGLVEKILPRSKVV